MGIESILGLPPVQLHFNKFMSHFAKVENGIVTQVIVADQYVIDSGMFGDGWVQTSYNTHGGKHPNDKPLRKNFASVGYIYDEYLDAFYMRKPFDSWVLNIESCLWEAPISYPQDGKNYQWDEPSVSWREQTPVV